MYQLSCIPFKSIPGPLRLKPKIKAFLNSCMDSGQLQLSIWCKQDRKIHKYGGWWTWNTTIRMYDCDVCYHFIFLFPQVHIPFYFLGQVVCSIILKCQFVSAWSFNSSNPHLMVKTYYDTTHDITHYLVSEVGKQVLTIKYTKFNFISFWIRKMMLNWCCFLRVKGTKMKREK